MLHTIDQLCVYARESSDRISYASLTNCSLIICRFANVSSFIKN